MTTSPKPLKLTPKDRARLARSLERFTRIRLLVVGDLMLDRYVWGRVERISPEAPVPVVSIESESIHLGGAANVAHNIVSLGAMAELAGVIGKDEEGQRFLHLLQSKGMSAGGIVADGERPTTHKTRVIGQHQQVLRIDREQKRPIAGPTHREMIDFIHRRAGAVSAVIVSDYAKGVVTKDLMSEIVKIGRQNNIPVIVDPKTGQFPFYRGATVVTPNALEAFQAASLYNVPGATPQSDGLIEAGETLRKRLGNEAILITRGERGMTLIDSESGVTQIPTVARDVFDVTGAGDTVIATFTLGIAAGLTRRDAAVLSNFAAGIVVRHLGAATLDTAQLRQAVEGK